MRTVSLRLADMEKVRIPIGLVGENLATRIIIDCKKIYEQYPYAAAALTVKSPFGEPFPAIVVHDGDFIYWDVTNTALTEDGEGEIQLSFTADEQEIRSERAKTIIKKSILPTGSVPDAIDDFLSRASAAVSLIPETINEALQEAKDSGDFDGFSPTATISQNDREVVIEITDKNGTTTSRFYMISNYTELGNKPSINNVVLEGNKSAADFGITMIPSGGTPGQYLTKASNTDYDIEWATETGETIDYSNLQNKPQIAGETLIGNKSLNDFGIASKNEVNAKADKTDTVLNTTLSMGRAPESTVGAHSTALGNDVIANANNMHAEGMHNIPDTVYPAWISGHHYAVGDIATNPDGVGVICKISNSDTSYSANKWNIADERGSNSAEKTAFVIGNGTDEYKSNAMRVDWNGNEYISGDMYVSSNNTATSGIKVATVEDVRESASGIELYVDQISSELGEDINRKANKTDTVLNTTLSLGRKDGTTVGTNSTALGNNVEASGSYSHAEGYQAIARGQMSHAEGNDSIASGTGAHSEGYHTTASASYSHAEGYGVTAGGSSSHAEGINTVASGSYSHAEGHTTTANHLAQHVFGQSNVPDTSSSSTSTRGSYVEIVGNGTIGNPSNARTLDWNGNERIAGDLYVNCNPNSTGGSKVVTTVEHQALADQVASKQDAPAVQGTAGQILELDNNLNPLWVDKEESGTSDYNDLLNKPQIAGITLSGNKTLADLGAAELDQNGKVLASQLPSYVDDVVEYDSINVFPATGESGKIYIAKDTNITYRWSGSAYVVIGTDLALGETASTAYRGDRGKAAYDAAVVNPDATPTANSTNLVQSGGVYSALETKYEKPVTGIPASDLASGVIPDVPVQDVQINATSIVSNGIANIQKASSSNLGVVGIEPQSGVDITSSGKLEINPASTADIKKGEHTNKPIVPFKQEVATFYGLATAAGDSTQSVSSNPVGTYTSEAKTAIQNMLGVSPASDVAAKYTKPAGGIPASDLANGVIPDITGKADKVDTVLDTTLSRGRAINTTVGTGSFAFGNSVEASGNNSHSEGESTHAIGRTSHAEGQTTYANGIASHAEGGGTKANGLRSHAEGSSAEANGIGSHAEGAGTIANGVYSHAEGMGVVADGTATHAFGTYNITNNFDCYDEWESGKEYLLNDVVKITDLQNDTVTAYFCSVPNNDSVFDSSHWINWSYMKFVEIVGNGYETMIDYSTYESVRTYSNARALDWDGNEYLNGDLYVNCNPDSTGGSRVATIDDTLIAVQDATPTDPDVKIWLPETTPQSIQVPTYSEFTEVESKAENVVAIQSTQPTSSDNKLWINTANSSTGIQIPTYAEHQALATEVGSKVSDVQVNGTSVVSQGVANIPLATNSASGVLHPQTDRGLSVGSTGILSVNSATSNEIKAGTQLYKPIAPIRQHESAFYGLAKSAGDNTQSASTNAVGTYTESAKSAISQMLNAPVTVSGTTVTITGLPGLRYLCGELTALDFTPSETGDVEIIFTSGSSPTVLTVTPPSVNVTEIKWPSWFDPDNLEANTVYDLIITNGEFGMVALWT